MKIRFPRKSTAGWIAIAAFVIAYDIMAIAMNMREESAGREKSYETLSDGVWKSLDHPRKRWVVWSAIAILAKHLAAPKFLRQLDPIGLVGLVVRGVLGGRYVRVF